MGSQKAGTDTIPVTDEFPSSLSLKIITKRLTRYLNLHRYKKIGVRLIIWMNYNTFRILHDKNVSYCEHANVRVKNNGSLEFNYLDSATKLRLSVHILQQGIIHLPTFKSYYTVALAPLVIPS